MDNNRRFTHALASFVILTGGLLLWRNAPNALAACDTRFQACSNISVTLSTLIPQAQGFIVPVTGSNVQVFDVYYCVADSATCAAQQITNTDYWKYFDQEDASTRFININVSTLRPNIAYPNLSLRFIAVGPWSTTQTVALGTFTTLPAFTPATSVVSGIQPFAATVNWNSSFDGYDTVNYGLNPPDWSTTATITWPFFGDATVGVTAPSDGGAWALSAFGGVTRYRLGVGWSTPTYPNGTSERMWAISSVGANAAVAVGDSHMFLWNGASWIVQNSPNPGYPFYGVHMTGPKTAWAVGGSEQVWYYNGTSWVDRSRSAATRNTAITLIGVFSSDDNKTVFVGGSAGWGGVSQDGGATWNYAILPGGGSSFVMDISGGDGKMIYAAGQLGKAWQMDRSVPTPSWTPITLNAGSGTMRIVNVVSPTKVLFSNGSWLISYTTDGTVTHDDGAFVSLSIAGLRFAATDDNSIIAVGPTTSAEFALNGTSVGTYPNIVPAGARAYTLTPLVPGKTYYYSATSYAGDLRRGVLGTFDTLPPDETPPNISFTAPTTTVYTKAATYDIAGIASDDVGLYDVSADDNGVYVPVDPVPSLFNNAAQNVTWSGTVNLVPGNNAIKATATDSSYNTKDATVTIVQDVQPPTLVIKTPVNNSTVNTSTVVVSGTAADNSSVTSMDYVVNASAPTTITTLAGGNWDFSLPMTVSGVYNVTVNARDQVGNIATATVSFRYTAPNFTITATNGPTAPVPIGTPANYTVTMVSQNTFNAPVAVTATVAPGSMTPTSSPATVTVTPTTPGVSTVSIPTASQASGDYTVTFTGAGGGQTNTITAQFTLVAPPDFSLSASPNAPTPDFVAGQGGSYTISVSPNTTFSGTVRFSLSNFPSGVTGSIAPTSVAIAYPNADTGTQLSVSTSTSLAAGDYTFTLTASSGTAPDVLSHSIAVPMHVIAAPDVQLTIAPAQQSVAAGGNPTFYMGAVKSLNAFTGTVNIGAVDPTSQAGLTLSLSKQSTVLTDGSTTSFVLDVVAASPTPAGRYTFTILACNGPLTGLTCGGTISKTTTVDLVVTADVTAPTITNVVPTPGDTHALITWETDEPTTGSVSVYTDAALTKPLPDVWGDGVCTATPCTHSVTITGLTQLTPYFFTVSAADFANPPNTSLKTEQLNAQLQFQTTETPDGEAPTLSVSSPADSAAPTTVIGQVAIAGTARDNKSVAKVKLNITAQPTTLWPDGLSKDLDCTGSTCTFAYNWVTNDAMKNGVYKISLQALDTSGNPSIEINRFVQLNNDFTKPLVLTGPDAVVSSTCGTGECSATISWTTNSMTTSQVDYGLTITSCDPDTGVCTYPEAPVRFDDNALNDPSRLMTDHHVTLHNLEAHQIYHYRITSCNGNGICTN